MRQQVIHLNTEAPAKPALGTTCNGCGVCCATEPCPIGQWISHHRSGRCRALEWSDDELRYRCGFVNTPKSYLPWLPASFTRKLALRWIASGVGCDATLSVQSPGAISPGA